MSRWWVSYLKAVERLNVRHQGPPLIEVWEEGTRVNRGAIVLFIGVVPAVFMVGILGVLLGL